LVLLSCVRLDALGCHAVGLRVVGAAQMVRMLLLHVTAALVVC
jgi:hypothetical protein